MAYLCSTGLGVLQGEELMIRKLPKDGTITFKRKFALFPTYTTDGYWVWLSWVVVKRKWFAYSKRWLYQGVQLSMKGTNNV
jgi:hypothetical protein